LHDWTQKIFADIDRQSMNILITGQQGLSQHLGEQLAQHHDVMLVSRSTGHDIAKFDFWGPAFYHYDCVINCAYDSIHQVKVLEQLYWAWKDDSAKQIINIGSIISSYPRSAKELEWEYMDYRVYKQALELAFARLSRSAQCDIKLINPGAIAGLRTAELSSVKMNPADVAQRIINVMQDPMIKRIDFWQ
jgi:hypothetical protein